MSTENNISFENDNFKYKSRVILGQAEVPKMTRFLIGKGVVKNEQSANVVLTTVTVISLLLSVLIFIVFVFDVNLSQKPEINQEAPVSKDRVEKLRQQRNSNLNNNIPN